MLFSNVVADYRSFMLLHTLMQVSACIADITYIILKEIYNALLVNNNWRFRFFSFTLIFDLVACKDRMYFGIYLSSEIPKLLA